VCSVAVFGVHEREKILLQKLVHVKLKETERVSSFLVLVCPLGAKSTEIELGYDYLVEDLFTGGYSY